MATRRSSEQAASGSTRSGSLSREARELAAQYSATGKKFKVKCLGSQEMHQFRPGDPAVKEIIRKLRQDASKQKNKIKATISLKLKELTVFDEKAKAFSLSVPIKKVKFVCHDHQDASVFAIVVQVEGADAVTYKLYCYQADHKVSVSCVRSLNEVFQLLHKIMQVRRQQQQQSQPPSTSIQSSSPSQAPQRNERSESPDDATPVKLGFGIPAPPPSYKSAISVKNSDKYRKPDNVVLTPVTLAPPPQSATAGRNRPQPTPRQQTTPTALGPPPVSHPVPKPRTRQTSLEQPAATIATQPPTQQYALSQSPAAPVQLLALTQSPVAHVAPVQSPAAPVQSPAAPVQLPVAPVQSPVAPVSTPSTTPSVPTTTQQTQSPQQDVWGEWRDLEGDLQSLAQDVGVDMSTNASISFDGQVSLSPGFDADPFADNFFQTSFGSLSAMPGLQDNSVAADLFASFPDIPPPPVTDPFSGPALTLPPLALNLPSVFEDPFASPSITTAPALGSVNDGVPSPTRTEPATNIHSVFEDPFASPSITTTENTVPTLGHVDGGTASPTPASDPFNSITTTPSANASATGFETNGFGSSFTASETPSSVIFDSNFSESPKPTTTTAPPPLAGPPPSRRRPSSRSSSTSLTPITASSFEANFSELSIATTAPPKAPVLTPPTNVQTPPTSPQTTPSVAPSQVQATPVQFEAKISDSPAASVSTAPPLEPPPPLPEPIFEANFSQSLHIPVTTAQQVKKRPLLSKPPPLPPRKGSSRSGTRPRGKLNDSVTTQQQNSPQTTSSINSELFSLQTTSSVFQPDSTNVMATPFPTAQVTETLPANFQVDSNWGASSFQSPTTVGVQAGPMPLEDPPALPGVQNTGFSGPVQQNFPIDPSWGGNNFQQPPSFPPSAVMQQQAFLPQQDFGQPQPQQVNMFQGNAQAMYQLPVEAPPIVRSYPPHMDSGIFSPPQTNSFMSDNPVDTSLNPFAGDFNSPPFAIHSSTPQSPARGGNNGYPPHQSPSPPAPPLRAVIEGPDPFAELLPLALSPSKEDKKPEEPPVVVTETPKTTQSKPQPKRPTLNDLYNNKHSFEAPEGSAQHDSVHQKASDQSFNNDFETTPSTSWIAF